MVDKSLCKTNYKRKNLIVIMNVDGHMTIKLNTHDKCDNCYMDCACTIHVWDLFNGKQKLPFIKCINDVEPTNNKLIVRIKLIVFKTL